jgi:hypothetical protein
MRKSKVADQKNPHGNLAAQIEFARRNIEAWPSWLRDNTNLSPPEPRPSEHQEKGPASSAQKASQDGCGVT